MENESDIQVTTNEPTQEELLEYYEKNFGKGIPDMSIGLTATGVAQAFANFVTDSGNVPPGAYVSGIITNVPFTGPEGTLPIGVYFQYDLEDIETVGSMN